MKIAVVGGGPAGLFFSILMKRADPRHEITIFERNRLDDPFGFGVVFSDATGHNLAEAEPETFAVMAQRFARWNDIDIHHQGQVLRSTGHGFSGLSRRALLEILAARARSLGVELRFNCEVSGPEMLRGADLILGADGFNSTVRGWYPDVFRPTIDVRPNRFVWLGSTRPFPAFTFYFKYDEHGLWRVHAYQYEGGCATFIVEATEQTWRAAGLEHATEEDTIGFCERLFADELEGHRLLENRSLWRQFATVRNECWHHGNVVLLGDAAHTVHFSIGSGTKLAMEDAIALAGALEQGDDVAAALVAFEAARRPPVESLQRAAQVSLSWFEDTERYMSMHPLQFAFSLLTRSLRLTHANLEMRDAAFVERVDCWFAERAAKQSGVSAGPTPAVPAPTPAPAVPAPARAPTPAPVVPPLFTPFKIRDLVLHNRVVVSPMCQYTAEDGTVGDWHIVHLGSRAIGGAALVMAEMTDVSREARISPGCAGLYKEEHVRAWKRVVDFVHRWTEAKIGIQLGHAGRKASTKLIWEGDNEPLEEGGWPILSASAIAYYPHSPVPREMSGQDMEAVKADYVRAAHMAEEAGFDWLELHCAHGYLLASFVSPLTNRRTDEYGGSLENRMRYPLEVFDRVRAAWPQHKPMSVRISAVDWLPGGVDSAEAVEIARGFKAHGVDIIDVSAGQTVAEQRPAYGRLFQTPFSDRIRHEAGIPTMAVGNISSYTDVNTILAAGRADLCLLARAHLWDPYWTRHAAYEMGYSYRWPNQYSSLNRYTPRFT
ncbi:MAG: bifunctional salicylyl-CoA 5-hydroxylase/oxidoreductase [Gemmatimonadetes bacterium]|nr:bifunctional salicylyl-CoA 5-hydroxylase/oxidoreductase [Gemmatimonadota bacterium]